MSVGGGEQGLCLTSDVTRAISKFLDFFLREHAKDNDEVLSFLETLVGFFESFWVDETAIDLGPACTWWNAFLMRL